MVEEEEKKKKKKKKKEEEEKSKGEEKNYWYPWILDRAEVTETVVPTVRSLLSAQRLGFLPTVSRVDLQPETRNLSHIVLQLLGAQQELQVKELPPRWPPYASLM